MGVCWCGVDGVMGLSGGGQAGPHWHDLFRARLAGGGGWTNQGLSREGPGPRGQLHRASERQCLSPLGRAGWCWRGTGDQRCSWDCAGPGDAVGVPRALREAAEDLPCCERLRSPARSRRRGWVLAAPPWLARRVWAPHGSWRETDRTCGGPEAGAGGEGCR